jgi:hypothetical protein
LGTRGMARQHSMTWGLRPDGERSSRITRPTRLRLQNKMAYATLFLRLATCPRGRPKTQLIPVDRRGCWDHAMLLTCKRFDNFLTQVVRRYCGVVQLLRNVERAGPHRFLERNRRRTSEHCKRPISNREGPCQLRLHERRLRSRG